MRGPLSPLPYAPSPHSGSAAISQLPPGKGVGEGGLRSADGLGFLAPGPRAENRDPDQKDALSHPRPHCCPRYKSDSGARGGPEPSGVRRVLAPLPPKSFV